MKFAVRWSEAALVDLDRPHEFLLQRASVVEDLELADRALEVIRSAADDLLARTPFSFRKAARSPLRASGLALSRELRLRIRALRRCRAQSVSAPSAT